MSLCELELWACVDDEGQYEVGTTQEAAVERYESEIGALNERSGFRLVAFTVKVPCPEPAYVNVEIPAGAEPALVSVKG